MKKIHKEWPGGETHWCFATVNGRLAEVFWHEDKKGKRHMIAHAYIKREKFATEQERQTIDAEAARNRVTYRNKAYKPQKGG